MAITGRRNPCARLDDYQAGLMEAVLEHGPTGKLIRRAGVIDIVLSGGVAVAGEAIQIEPPASAPPTPAGGGLRRTSDWLR